MYIDETGNRHAWESEMVLGPKPIESDAREVAADGLVMVVMIFMLCVAALLLGTLIGSSGSMSDDPLIGETTVMLGETNNERGE